MSYRAGLIAPFLWSSLHAIEKYLKAILLFNEKKAKGCGHDIDKLLSRVKEIKGLDLRLPISVESFIKYLNVFGENRYFEGTALLVEYALDNLDETVWYIRRYCYYTKEYEKEYYRNTRKIPPLEQEKYPKNYNLSGILEKIIKEELDAYPYLTWNNFFYGKNEHECDRNFIRKSQSKFSAINPTLVLFGQEAFDILVKYVDFSSDTKKYFGFNKICKIKVQIYEGEESGFVVECVELPIVTQGQTLDEVTLNLREAISLHLEGEDLAALGFAPNPPIVVNYEMATVCQN